MSASQDKRARKKLRKLIKTEVSDSAGEVQKFILEKPWRQRITIALKIIAGKPFFNQR